MNPFQDDDENNDDVNVWATSKGMYIPLVVTQMVISTMSILACIVVTRIARPKLGSTYQRFLFGWSLAIILNSIFLFLNPLLVPQQERGDDGAYWAFGNDATCTTGGYFLIYGALLVALYSNALALYFYFSIQTNSGENSGKRPQNPEDVIGWPEIMTNTACWALPAAVAGAGAATDSFNYDPRVGMCVLFSECDDPSDSSCIEIPLESPVRYGNSSTVIIRSTFLWMLVATAVVSVVVTLRIRCQVQKALEGMQQQQQQQQQEQRDGDPDLIEQQQMGQKLVAVSVQCLLYTLSFLNSYIWFIAIMFIPANNVNLFYAFQLIATVFYPAIGVVTCIIYIRPRVQMLQIMYSQDPFVVVLRVAMSKAGDPEEIENIRAEIYGSEYSGSEPRYSVDDDDDYSRDSAIPSVVHFDPLKPISIKSLVSAPGEDDDKNSTVSALGVGDGVGGVTEEEEDDEEEEDIIDFGRVDDSLRR